MRRRSRLDVVSAAALRLLCCMGASFTRDEASASAQPSYDWRPDPANRPTRGTLAKRFARVAHDGAHCLQGRAGMLVTMRLVLDVANRFEVEVHGEPHDAAVAACLALDARMLWLKLYPTGVRAGATVAATLRFRARAAAAP